MGRMEVDLSPDERRELEHIVKHKRDARMVKRAQALLWLNEGEKIMVIPATGETTDGIQLAERCTMHEIKSP